MNFSVVLIVRNEASTIEGCLKSVKNFSDDIIVIDGFSTDDTVKIAKKYTNKFFFVKPKGYTEPFREFGVSKAKHEWILNLDADERITQELKKEIRQKTEEGEFDAFYIPRKNFFLGHWIKLSYPDYQLRLYKKGAVRFTPDIHAGLHPVKKAGKIRNALLHYSFRSWKQLEERRDRTSTIEAENLSKKINAGIFDMIKYFFIKPAVIFLYYLVLRGGFKNGRGDIMFCFDSLLYNISIAEKAFMMKEENTNFS
jgi:glycosyltransferase involved in cell wall biosynthesis